MRYVYSLIALLLLFSTVSAADDLTAAEIVKKVSDLINQQSAEAKMKLTIVTTSGDERTFVYDSYSADKNEKNAIVYLSPARVKGQAMLLLNNADDIWAYYPRTDRVRKLATHAKKQKMQGSDFTYEDMGSGDSFVTDFVAKKLPDEKIKGEDCYKVELTKKKKSSSNYAKMVMWVIKTNFVPVVIDYYDEDDPTVCAKRLVQSNIKDIDNVPTPMDAVMHNNLDDSDTKLEIVECKYNIKIDANRFTERGFYR
jgi:outer membrane lipoprotein-sorting protein